MSYVIGFDASTQSCSATLVHNQVVAGELSVNFGKELPQYNAPSGFIEGGDDGEVHSNPMMWLDALDLLLSKMVKSQWPLDQVVAISGSGQQHGSVYLGDSFTSVVGELSAEQSLADQIKPCLTRGTSPIWMDNSTSAECAEISETVGGSERVCSLTGSIMIERFTGAQIRKFSKQEPSAYEKTARIHLVSSFLASVLSGSQAPIDTGDGAGMNLMNLAAADWDADMVSATASDLAQKLPPVAKPHTLVGKVSSYFTQKYGLNAEAKVYVWSGDNPCSLVGMGAATPGKMVISLGTSYTLFAAMNEPLTDPNGYGHVFGNPMGGNMSLICFMNGSLAREKVRESKEVDWSQFGNDYLTLTAAGNDGKVMLPFYEPEITPAVSLGEIATNGWSLDEESAAVQIRACLEGQIMNMKLHSAWLGQVPSQIMVTGGGSKSDQICQVIADIFNAEVVRMKLAASASLGAAIMAGVAHGCADLNLYEKSLCAIDEEARVLPSADAQSTYAGSLDTFEKLLSLKLS